MYEALQAALGYQFHDPALLCNALTHSSYANENKGLGLSCNERLEFLGDSILGFTVAEFLYRKFPHRPEGEMTKMRADMVCEATLAQVADSLHIGQELLLSHGEDHGGGRLRPSILADAMESVLAAVYLDGGMEAVLPIISRLILTRVPTKQLANQDYKTALQELVQKHRDSVLTYRLVNEQGPDHQKSFLVEVSLNGKPIGTGEGTSKKRAEQAAAQAALAALQK